jgi:hypothetical protein
MRADYRSVAKKAAGLIQVKVTQSRHKKAGL